MVAKGMKEYEVEMNGVMTTVQLNESDAERSPGVKLVTRKAAATPENKSRGAANKGGSADAGTAGGGSGD